MKKGTKIYLGLIILVLAIIILIFALKDPVNPQGDRETVKCIAENSLLYSSFTCSACKNQEELFGDNYDLINKIDCFYEGEKCSQAEIRGTPTWIINDQEYLGIKTIEELKELTGC
tara:strand:+ start:146 stop:493 length:348 start_codon:yes stop_codon:yes gene_type:complete